MPGYGRTYRTTRRPVRRSTRAPPRRRAAATVIQKAVRRAKVTRFNQSVHRAMRTKIERKFKVFNIFGNATSASNIPGAGFTTPQNNGTGLLKSNLLGHDMVSLEQGTNTGQRVGNRVSDCRLTLKGYVINNTSATVDLPFFVHVLVYKKTSDISGDNTELLKKPNQSVGGVTHALVDQLYPWNKSAYIIRRYRRFKLRPPPTNTGDTDVYYNPQTTNAPTCRFFRIGVPIAKTLRFDNQSSQAGFQTPNNDWCALGVYVTLGDGADMNHNFHAAEIYMDGIFSFTDA